MQWRVNCSGCSDHGHCTFSFFKNYHWHIRDTCTYPHVIWSCQLRFCTSASLGTRWLAFSHLVPRLHKHTNQDCIPFQKEASARVKVPRLVQHSLQPSWFWLTTSKVAMCCWALESVVHTGKFSNVKTKTNYTGHLTILVT